MIEYDFSISLESMEKEEGRYRMYFPHSCILHLRGNEETRFLTIEVVMPDKSTWEYKVPAVYAGYYTKEEILGKRLFFLLPFYIMRYEKKDLDGEHQELKKNAGSVRRDRSALGKRISGRRKRERIS